MRECAHHYAQCGFPVPQLGNPNDFYLDVVTPGGPKDHVVEMVDGFRKLQLDRVLCEVAAGLAEPKGNQIVDVIRDRLDSLEIIFGAARALGLHDTVYAVPIRTQFREVFGRQALLTFNRGREGLVFRFSLAVAKGLIVGSAFIQIGNESDRNQISFVFMLLQVAAISGIPLIPELVDNRHVMKLETSEALYSEFCYIIANFVIQTPLAIVDTSIFFIIMFSMGAVPWSHFGIFYHWTILMTIAFDAIFACAAAVAPDAAQAQNMCLPVLFLFLIYNGFTANKQTIKIWLRGALYISPVAWAFEQVSVSMFKDTPGYAVLQQEFAFNDSTAYTLYAYLVMGAIFWVFRFLEAYALIHFNNIVR
eukprot:TRINITY_DN2299_c0_g2_i3.p1 TRINITY_DN2299_c0_g2~~TRINITY_DN2299_c0_g2_i3.p1  ORF type:complete len:363 (+),score=114.12 TRINITY_DN2299_c0_g2_i3:172-1260(+)